MKLVMINVVSWKGECSRPSNVSYELCCEVERDSGDDLVTRVWSNVVSWNG